MQIADDTQTGLIATIITNYSSYLHYRQLTIKLVKDINRIEKEEQLLVEKLSTTELH